MTEDEWRSSDDPFAMLVHLRGRVTEDEKKTIKSSLHCSGVLYDGPGEQISATQCRRFIIGCGRRLYDLSPDQSWQFMSIAYLLISMRELPREEVLSAISLLGHQFAEEDIKIANQFATWEWMENPLGAGRAAWNLGYAIAYVKAKESIAVTCANETEEDRSYWGWGGPPDPVWQESCKAEYRYQAGLLHSIVGNPFAKSRKECEYGES